MAHHLRAKIYANCGQLSDAFKELKIAINLDSNNALLINFQGMLLLSNKIGGIDIKFLANENEADNFIKTYKANLNTYLFIFLQNDKKWKYYTQESLSDLTEKVIVADSNLDKKLKQLNVDKLAQNDEK